MPASEAGPMKPTTMDLFEERDESKADGIGEKMKTSRLLVAAALPRLMRVRGYTKARLCACSAV